MADTEISSFAKTEAGRSFILGAAIRKWDAFELEEQANRAGLQATVVRSPEEFSGCEQCRYLENLPLVHIEKIADGAPGY